MDMPRPTAGHEKLTRLCGNWTGTETMHPSQWCPDGATADGRITSRPALSGFAVVCDYEQAMHGQVTFSGHGVYTIDPQNDDVVLHWFDSMGGQREEFRGGWDGDRLVTCSENPMMGRMRMTYELQADGSLKSMMECSPDGENWSVMFDGVYHRAN